MEANISDLTWAVVAFENVNSKDATYKLSQLNVASTEFAYWNNDYIATIASSGAQDKYYTWDPDMESWYECDDIQTIDYDAPANDVALPMNQAIFINSLNGDILTVSGAVLAGDSELYTVEGDLTFTGNFTPATITLGDIVIKEGEFAYWNNDYIATVASSGAQDKYYTWDPDMDSWYECDDIQMIDYDAPANDVEINANQAIIVNTLNNVILNIPSPLN